jgi:hypothetical protein
VLPAPPQPFLIAKEKDLEEELVALEEELELEQMMTGGASESLLEVAPDLLDEDEEYEYGDVEEDEEDDLMD